MDLWGRVVALCFGTAELLVVIAIRIQYGHSFLRDLGVFCHPSSSQLFVISPLSTQVPYYLIRDS